VIKNNNILIFLTVSTAKSETSYISILFIKFLSIFIALLKKI